MEDPSDNRDAPIKGLSDDALFIFLDYVDFETKLSLMRLNKTWEAFMRKPESWRRLNLFAHPRVNDPPPELALRLNEKFLPAVGNAIGRGQGKIIHVDLPFASLFSDVKNPVLLHQLLGTNLRSMRTLRSETQIAGPLLWSYLPLMTNLRCLHLFGEWTQVREEGGWAQLGNLQLPSSVHELILHDKTLPVSMDQVKPRRLKTLQLGIIDYVGAANLFLELLSPFKNTLQQLKLERLEIDPGVEVIAADDPEADDSGESIFLDDFTQLTALEILNCNVNLCGRLPSQLRSLAVIRSEVSAQTLRQWCNSDLAALQEVKFCACIGPTWPWLRFFLTHSLRFDQDGITVRRTLPRELKALTGDWTTFQTGADPSGFDALDVDWILQQYGRSLRCLTLIDQDLPTETLDSVNRYCDSLTQLEMFGPRLHRWSAGGAINVLKDLKSLTLSHIDPENYGMNEHPLEELCRECDQRGITHQLG